MVKSLIGRSEDSDPGSTPPVVGGTPLDPVSVPLDPVYGVDCTSAFVAVTDAMGVVGCVLTDDTDCVLVFTGITVAMCVTWLDRVVYMWVDSTAVFGVPIEVLPGIGAAVGKTEGTREGSAVGIALGDAVGWRVGAWIGAGVGNTVVGVAVVGVDDGTDVGSTVGALVVGRSEGVTVGVAVGTTVGAVVRRVGTDVGVTVGVGVGAHVPPANVVGMQSQIVAAGISMSLLQLEDANASLDQNPLLTVMFGRRKYRRFGVVWNAADLRYWTVSGRDMDISPSQNAKASKPIMVTLSGKLTNCSPSAK